ncbi:bacteriocin-like protein [Chryseobacterium lathyri]|jgi:hypothetical protein|uniref:bacteriocin-like protein n=1 Tax=Chryseobacterium lathyri TaxID=395933 RepID=UPI001CBE98D0|nr:hypothetical protein [Chryseobacterium lathyri]
MKNLKKVSREQLKQVNGGSGTPRCKIGFIYRCDAIGVCDELSGLEDCLCGCKPVIPNP